jgi:proteasome lid subunit RPN8/RPN11
VRIARLLAEQVHEHARSGYPFEVCGVFVGREGAVLQVERVANRETESPRVRYQIAPEDLFRIQREAREAGHEILGYYHSHPDHPARPSETDRRIAAEGLSDGVVHMVFSVDGSGRTVPSAWVFRDARHAFEEEPMAVVDGGRQQEEDGCRSRS